MIRSSNAEQHDIVRSSNAEQYDIVRSSNAAQHDIRSSNAAEIDADCHISRLVCVVINSICNKYVFWMLMPLGCTLQLMSLPVLFKNMLYISGVWDKEGIHVCLT